MHYDLQLVAHKLIRWESYLNGYRFPDWKEIPNIGLYMEQMIALLTQYLDFIPVEDPKEKPVTATAIHNYVRLRVMPAPEKRKYYRVHIAYLIMIFTLKQSVSIQGIQKILPQDLTEEQVKNHYMGFVAKHHCVSQYFTQQTRDAARDILNPQSTDESTDESAIENFVTQMVLTAGFSRLLVEKLLRLKDADTDEILRLEEEKD